jgi:hypothetical protein
MNISNDTIQNPSPRDYLDIFEKLEEISFDYPFEILFYGSRERGDCTEDSDFNFYLLASTQDQMKPGFIQKITLALNHLEKIAPVNLIAGDVDTFRLRLNLMEPSVLHLLNLGSVFYGDSHLNGFNKDWEKLKNQPIPKEKLIPFLNRRIRFYKNLTPRSDKEESVRMERVVTLSIQSWAIQKISDISVPELIALDIPSRAEKMIHILYKNELDPEILNLLNDKKEAVALKKLFQREKDYPQSMKEHLTTRIKQLKNGTVFI